MSEVPVQQSMSTQSMGFAETSVQVTNTMAVASAQHAKAMVEARFVMAMQRPRDENVVRQTILNRCADPAFAAEAVYHKPAGRRQNPQTHQWEQVYVTGLTIRFFEEALRLWGNIDVSEQPIHEDDNCVVLEITVLDLETNASQKKVVTMEKTIERKPNQCTDKRSGNVTREPISKRSNSYGDEVWLVRATEDEFNQKLSAACAKVRRTLGLPLLPAEIRAIALAACIENENSEVSKDPALAARNIMDAFSKMGVMPDQLEKYLGHEVSTIVESEIKELRSVYKAIRSNETTWHEALEGRSGQEDTEKSPLSTDDLAPGEAKTHTEPDESLADQKSAEAREAFVARLVTLAKVASGSPAWDNFHKDFESSDMSEEHRKVIESAAADAMKESKAMRTTTTVMDGNKIAEAGLAR